MSTPQPEETVSPGAAYQAARERAQRTTDALILAEAQIIELKAGYGRLMQQLVAADEDHWRPTDEGPAEFVCPHKAGDVSDGSYD